MFANKVKIYGVPISYPVLRKHLVIGQCQKLLISWLFTATHCSVVSIGQHIITMRVVHLPKRTETSLIAESDRSGPIH